LPNVVKRLVIEGRVQGVGFRYALADEARARGLSGWVRNRRNGDVEAIVAGPEEDIAALVAWAHHGPPAAQGIAVRVELATGEFTGFDIAPTI
jgi:acylphosphatase